MEADRAFFEAYSTSDSPLDTLFNHLADGANVLPPGAPMARDKEESLAVFAALEELPGYSLTVWKKQPDGTWKIAVDMFNANGATASVEE
jgi:ketosteroid isomerase-like protein